MAMTSHNQSPSDMYAELDPEWMQKLFESQADAQYFNEIHEVFQQPLAQCTGSGWGTGEIREGFSGPRDDATITEHDEAVDQSLVIQALTERITFLESQESQVRYKTSSYFVITPVSHDLGRTLV